MPRFGPVTSPLSIDMDRPAPARGCVRVRGRLDASNAHAFLDAIEVELHQVGDDDLTELVLDLEAVSSCDDVGLRAFLLGRRRALASGTAVATRLSPTLRRALTSASDRRGRTDPAVQRPTWFDV